MTKIHRILAGSFMLLLTAAVGFAGGLYFKSNQHPPPIIAGTEKPAPKPNHNTYDISPPSRGGAIRTIAVPIEPVENTAQETMDAEKASDVKTGQKVLLRDANDKLLDIPAEISAVTDNRDGTVLVTMTLEGDENVPSSLAVKADIITDRQSSAQRLPLSAIVAENHLWEIARNEDGTFSAYYKRVNVPLKTEEFAVIYNAASSSNIYILNPDDRLEDGQKINVREIMYAGPAQTPDQRIAVTAADRELKLWHEHAVEAARAGQSSSGEGESGCAPLPDITADFIRQIKNLAAKPAPLPSSETPASSQ